MECKQTKQGLRCSPSEQEYSYLTMKSGQPRIFEYGPIEETAYSYSPSIRATEKTPVRQELINKIIEKYPKITVNELYSIPINGLEALLI